jgi:hypothetical protein
MYRDNVHIKAAWVKPAGRKEASNAAIDRGAEVLYQAFKLSDEIQPIRAPVESLVRFRSSVGQVSLAFNLNSIIRCRKRRMAIQLTLAATKESARGSDHSSSKSIQLWLRLSRFKPRDSAF